ncbi:MAG: hypothetical protein LKF36_10435 [Lactobacillus sp.]|jgi:hypothetical protein|nr:hypothetical protein [Lactobacillus sp.]
MTSTSKIKYLGIAAAALLATAPAVATAVVPGFTGSNITTVQAADGGLSGEFDADQTSYILAKATPGSKFYSDAALTTEAGSTAGGDLVGGLGAFYAVVSVQMTNGQVTAYHLMDSDLSKDDGWLAPDKITKFGVFDGTAFNPSTGDATFKLNTATNVYTTDGTGLSATALILDGTSHGIKAVSGTNDFGETQTIDAGKVTTNVPEKALTEVTDGTDGVKVSPVNKKARIYSNKGTTKVIDSKALSEATQIEAFVQDPDGNTVAYRIAKGQYVKAADVTSNADDSKTLTEATLSGVTVTAKADAGAQLYSDKGTISEIANTKIGNSQQYPAVGKVTNASGTIVAYKLADKQYVKAGDVNVTGDTGGGGTTTGITESKTTGTVQTKNIAQVYTDSAFTKGEDVRIGSGQTLNYTSVLKDGKGTIVGYGFTNGDHTSYIKAADVQNDVPGTGTGTGDLTIAVVPAGTMTVNSGGKAVTVYSDAATTKDSGAKLDTAYSTWAVNQTAKDKDGKTVAYDLGNNQWVKASDVTAGTTSSVTTSATPTGMALYSNFKAATIYSDPETTQANGSLMTAYDEWSAFKVAKDANGNPVAYDLGNNQWVKASDLQLQKALSGTFDAAAGTSLYSSNGALSGTIKTGGLYQVFAVTYLNGRQAVKLGNDNQWIIAATGDYYPA